MLEEILEVKRTNWNLIFKNRSGLAYQVVRLSGIENLKLIIAIVERGFSYGSIDHDNWEISLYRGREIINIKNLSDCSEAKIREKWPDYNENNENNVMQFDYKQLQWNGNKYDIILESKVNQIHSSMFPDEKWKEFDKILQQVFSKYS